MSTSLFDLSGKTALVTGGGTGIGRAIAEALSDAGAYLMVVGRREDKLVETLEGRDGLPIPADLVADGPLTLIKKACETHGTFPDIIVNAAGINPRKHADEVTPEIWAQTIHIPGTNLRVTHEKEKLGANYQHRISTVGTGFFQRHRLWCFQRWCKPAHACHGRSLVNRWHNGQCDSARLFPD